MESEADDAEKNGENQEATELDWFATDSIDCGNRDPISGNEARHREDEVTNTIVVQPGKDQLYQIEGTHFR